MTIHRHDIGGSVIAHHADQPGRIYLTVGSHDGDGVEVVLDTFHARRLALTLLSDVCEIEDGGSILVREGCQCSEPDYCLRIGTSRMVRRWAPAPDSTSAVADEGARSGNAGSATPTSPPGVERASQPPSSDERLATPSSAADYPSGIEHWVCECGDLNGLHEHGCYRCGAGQPDEDPVVVSKAVLDALRKAALSAGAAE